MQRDRGGRLQAVTGNCHIPGERDHPVAHPIAEERPKVRVETRQGEPPDFPVDAGEQQVRLSLRCALYLNCCAVRVERVQSKGGRACERIPDVTQLNFHILPVHRLRRGDGPIFKVELSPVEAYPVYVDSRWRGGGILNGRCRGWWHVCRGWGRRRLVRGEINQLKLSPGGSESLRVGVVQCHVPQV